MIDEKINDASLKMRNDSEVLRRSEATGAGKKSPESYLSSPQFTSEDSDELLRIIDDVVKGSAASKSFTDETLSLVGTAMNDMEEHCKLKSGGSICLPMWKRYVGFLKAAHQRVPTGVFIPLCVNLSKFGMKVAQELHDLNGRIGVEIRGDESTSTSNQDQANCQPSEKVEIKTLMKQLGKVASYCTFASQRISASLATIGNRLPIEIASAMLSTLCTIHGRIHDVTNLSLNNRETLLEQNEGFFLKAFKPPTCAILNCLEHVIYPASCIIFQSRDETYKSQIVQALPPEDRQSCSTALGLALLVTTIIRTTVSPLQSTSGETQMLSDKSFVRESVKLTVKEISICLHILLDSLTYLVGRHCGSISDNTLLDILADAAMSIPYWITEDDNKIPRVLSVIIKESVKSVQATSIYALRRVLARWLLTVHIKHCNTSQKAVIMKTLSQLSQGKSNCSEGAAGTLALTLLGCEPKTQLKLIKELVEQLNLVDSTISICHLSHKTIGSGRSIHIASQKNKNTSSSQSNNMEPCAVEMLLKYLPLKSLLQQEELKESVYSLLNTAAVTLSNNVCPSGFQYSGAALALLCNAGNCGVKASHDVDILINLANEDLRPATRMLIRQYGTCARYIRYILDDNPPGSMSVDQIRNILNMILNISGALHKQEGPVKLLRMALHSCRECARLCYAIIFNQVPVLEYDTEQPQQQRYSLCATRLALIACRASLDSLRLACCSPKTSTEFPIDEFPVACEACHFLLTAADSPNNRQGGLMYMLVLKTLNECAPLLPTQLRSKIPQLVPKDHIPLLKAHREHYTVSRHGNNGNSERVSVTSARRWQRNAVSWNYSLLKSNSHINIHTNKDEKMSIAVSGSKRSRDSDL